MKGYIQERYDICNTENMSCNSYVTKLKDGRYELCENHEIRNLYKNQYDMCNIMYIRFIWKNTIYIDIIHILNI